MFTMQCDAGIITAEIVSRMLGLLDTGTIIKFAQLIIANDPAAAIGLLEEVYANTNSLEYFVQAMADFMAELSKSKVIVNYHNLLYQSYSQEISDILIGTGLSRITILWQIFSNGVYEIKQSHNELITAQMLIIKAIYACNLPSTEEIMDAGKLSSQIAADPVQEKSNISESPGTATIPEKEIFDFLKYCHDQKEIEIYYLLLNEVEVKEFVSEEMTIAGNINSNVAGKIRNLLKDWSSKDWKIVIFKQDNITSLKDKMLEQVKERGDYQLIKNNFPEANISDIILKT